MLSRILIHSKNFYIFLRWIFYEYYDFKVFLESQGYYSILFYRAWLWDEDSKYCEISKDLKSNIQNSQLEIIRNSGHAPHIDQPLILANIIQKFIKS